MADHTYYQIKILIESGTIVAFDEIFQYLPPGKMATDLMVDEFYFASLIENPFDIQFGLMYKVADLLDIEEREALRLVENQLARK